MYRNIWRSLAAAALFFLMNGCVHRELPQLPYNHGIYGSGDQESIDISDLDANLTESGAPLMQDGRVPRIPFPVEEYMHLRRMGKGTIKGRIYLEDGMGTKIYGRNTRLYLNPKTSYSDQWYEESYLGGHKMQKADDRLFDYLRFTSSDTQGNFAFYGVPSGSYYLIGTVKCASECGYATPKNVRIATLVTVHGNETVHKDLKATIDY